ncbi:hypothetical protein [Cesiribacter sp. SM1]|uniref:hypothetical protein n=1 Tax=Cesiribacter sp. SM1 TaxID=2861196 RepID=UPI001CD6D050|nr:hypothetical protein [Cesiribacter sp. SM1]
MKIFITDEFKTATKRLNEIVETVNQQLKTVDNSVLRIYEGKTLLEVEVSDIAQFLKNKKAESLTSFQEQLAVGVDLRKQIKLTDKEASDIATVDTLINSFNQFVGDRGLLHHITVSKGKASINHAGLAYLESLKITLNKKELRLWESINSIRDMVYTDHNSKFLLYRIFNPSQLNELIQQTDFDLRTFKNTVQRYNLK